MKGADEHAADRFTAIDNILEMQTTVLKNLLGATHNTNSLLASIAGKPDFVVGSGAAKHVYNISYPETGKKQLNAGKTTINLKNAEITLPPLAGAQPDSGTTEYLSFPIPDDIGRSVLIITEKELTVEFSLDSKSNFVTSVFPKVFRKTDIEFNQIAIDAASETNFWISMSSDKEGVPEIDISKYEEGNPFVDRGAVVTAGSAQTIDVRGSIGRNVHSGRIQNLSGAATLFVALSNDGSTYASAFWLYPQQHYDLNETDDVDSIRLDASANATPYQIVLM